MHLAQALDFPGLSTHDAEARLEPQGLADLPLHSAGGTPERISADALTVCALL